MSADSRVKRWRNTKRQHGLKAVTIWLTTEEELRLKDLALTWHCSPSAAVQQALAKVSHTEETGVQRSIPTDMLLIRQLIREELAMTHATNEPVTVGYTVGPTDTSNEPVTVGNTVGPTDTSVVLQPDEGKTAVTEAVPGTEPRSQARVRGERTSDVLAVLAQRQPATAAEVAQALGDGTRAGTKAVWQALQGLLKRDAVLRDGQHYRLPA